MYLGSNKALGLDGFTFTSEVSKKSWKIVKQETWSAP